MKFRHDTLIYLKRSYWLSFHKTLPKILCSSFDVFNIANILYLNEFTMYIMKELVQFLNLGQFRKKIGRECPFKSSTKEQTRDYGQGYIKHRRFFT